MRDDFRLSHVCIKSIDLENTIKFYEELLDAQVVHEFINDEHERYGVFLKISQGNFIEVFQLQEESVLGNAIQHFCIEVQNIDEMAMVARTQGYDVEVRRGRSDRVLQFFVTDPNGILVEFQQHDNQSALEQHV